MSFGTASMGVGAIEPAADAPFVAVPVASTGGGAVSMEARRSARGGERLTLSLIRFGAWMAGQRREPSPEQVAARFGIAKASAYRWLAAWREVQP